MGRRDDDADLLPEVTQDETGPGWGDDPDRYRDVHGDIDDDQRLRDERPPHWD